VEKADNWPSGFWQVDATHNGVLFLDKLPEFWRNVLEVLRQPLEEGMVTISRAMGSVSVSCPVHAGRRSHG